MQFVTTATICHHLRSTTSERPIEIPLFNGGSMHAHLDPQLRGVRVDNLRNSPLLPWSVFETAIGLLREKPEFKARTGNARGPRVGSPGCPVDSLEGHIAVNEYGKQEGDAATSRVSPIRAILEYTGIASNSRGYIKLDPVWINQNSD